MKKHTDKSKTNTELFFQKDEISVPGRILPEAEKRKKNIKLLLHQEAINQLLCFMRQDYIKAGQDILKIYGQESLRDKIYNSIITIDKSSNTNPLLMFSKQEKKYDEVIEKLKLEIEQLIPLAGGRNVRPLIISLKEELTSIKAMLISTDNMAELNKLLQVKIDPRHISSDLSTMMGKYGIILFKTGKSVEDVVDAANKVDPLLLKPYSEFVLGQHLKLARLCSDMVQRVVEDREQIIADRNNYKALTTLTEMFVDNELLIKICDELVKVRKYKGKEIQYVQKVNDGEYRWLKNPVKLAAFGSWLSKNKDRLLINKKDFEPGKHRGWALCNYFDLKIKPAKKQKDDYQQFQNSKIADDASVEFDYLNAVH